MRLTDSIIKDFGYALRVLKKSPGFTAIAILSLALGIGANTAIFSLVYGVILRPLPYRDPQQLVQVGRHPSGSALSIAEYELIKGKDGNFAGVAGHRGVGEQRLQYASREEWVDAMTITADFFRTLGTPLAVGREFSAQEARAGGPLAVILTNDAWNRLFDADPAAIGKIVSLNGKGYTVVGVTQGDLWLPNKADLFIPLQPSGGLSDLGMNTQVFARLKPTATLHQANTELSLAAENFRRMYPDRATPGYRGLEAIPYQNWLVGDARMKLLLLMGSTGLLLLIACLNLVNLMLARLTARQKEIAVRLALGSSRARLLQQFVIEGIVICGAGAIAGVLTAKWLLNAFLVTVPFSLPASASIELNEPVLVFTAALTLGAVLLVSVAPIWIASRLTLHDTLKQSGSSVTSGSNRLKLRHSLVVAEVAVSATLLVGAFLLIHSFYQMSRQQLGFSPTGVLTFRTPPASGQSADIQRLKNLTTVLLEQLQALPGVRSVSVANVLPLSSQNNFPVQRKGHADMSIGGMEIRLVSPSYFDTLRVPLRLGRLMTDHDTAQSTPVALVNETVARQWWPNGNAIGDRIVMGLFRGKALTKETPSFEVIGVVGDTKTVRLTEPPRPTIFIPLSQSAELGPATSWLIRGEIASGLPERVRQKVKELEPSQRIEAMRTMEDIVESGTAGTRFNASLFGAFAGLALLVSAIGIYGLLSFSVVQRTKEIGTRMALGANRDEVLALVLKQGLTLIVVGLVLGIGGALMLARFLSSMLFEVHPQDPLSLIAVTVLLLLVGLLASYIPARRATKVDPLIALRSE